MNTLIPTLATAGPLAAGWSAHTLWLRRQLHRARRDPLTGLRTRAAFTRAATRALARGPHLVLVIDLDGFKALNDTYGHEAGDHALNVTASDLTEVLEGERGGVVARLGGDEFAAVVPATQLPEAALWLLRGLHDQLTTPLHYQGRPLPLGASIGACRTAELPAPDVSLALRRADEAMYTAKRGGGGWYLADGPAPTHTTTAGRRTGRRGATPKGGARS